MKSRSSIIYICVFALCAIAISVLVYHPGLSGDYVFDDIPNLLQNEKLHADDISGTTLLQASLSSDSGLLKRPISMLTFFLNYNFFGKPPFSFKITNLALHILNGLGIFLIGYFSLQAKRLVCWSPASNRDKALLAGVVALVWLAHPINLSPVLYIVQRMTELSALFTIFGLVFYIRYRLKLEQSSGSYLILASGILFFLIAATLSKENGVLLPVYLVLIESFLFAFSDRTGQLDRKIVAGYLLLLAIPTAALLSWFLLNRDFFFSGYALRDFTLSERLLTETRVLTYYIQLIMFPTITELGLFHDDISISRSLTDPISTTWATIFLSALLTSSLMLYKRAPIYSLGILWFFGSHLLESTFLPLEIAHEHRNYLASYGIIISIVAASQKLLSAIRIRMAASITIIILWMTALGTVTHLRSLDWSSSIYLSLSEADHHPTSPRATYAAARTYANLVFAGETHLTEKAILSLQHAKHIGDKNISADVALIIFFSKLTMPIDRQILEDLKKKVATHPITSNTIQNLKLLILCNRDACNLETAYIGRLLEAGASNKQLMNATRTRAEFYTVYADFVLNDLRDSTTANWLFESAVAAYPYEPQYLINHIRFLTSTGHHGDAIIQLSTLEHMNIAGELDAVIRELRAQTYSPASAPSGSDTQDTMSPSDALNASSSQM